MASASLVAAAAELAAGSLHAGARNRAALAAIALVWLRADGFVLPVFLTAALLVTRTGVRSTIASIALPAALAQALLFALRRLYYDAGGRALALGLPSKEAIEPLERHHQRDGGLEPLFDQCYVAR